jgi:heme a synthase
LPLIALWTLSVLFLQFLFGAYTAGLEAGYAFNSWPKMGDEWFPADTPMLSPFLANLVDNPVVVQFVHRWLAFLAAGLVFALAYAAWRKGLKGPAGAAVVAVIFQMQLGILTLLSGVELHIAVAHQGMAALLLGAVVLAAYRLGERRTEAAS